MLSSRALVAALAIFAVACSKDSPVSTTELSSSVAAPAHATDSPSVCDAKAIDPLVHDLDAANGINLDRSSPKDKATIDSATRAVTGRVVSLTGCSFAMQGNDLVWFARAGLTGRAAVDAGISCKMKGGVAGVTAFRNAAMGKGVDSLVLDVRGVVAVQDDFLERLGLTECEITVR